MTRMGATYHFMTLGLACFMGATYHFFDFGSRMGATYTFTHLFVAPTLGDKSTNVNVAPFRHVR